MTRGSNCRDLAVAVAALDKELRRCRRNLRDLRTENEILREAAASLIHQAAAGERFAFIHARRDRFSVKLMCRILVADGGNYRAWARNQGKRRDREYDDQQLIVLIFEVHTAYPAYGALRVTRELQRLGVPVGRRVVARLMWENGICGRTRRKRRNLTKPDAGAAAVPDLIRRDFTAPMPGLKLTGDITCFPNAEGWLYLATALDLCSRELIGYAIAPHMRASLAVDALTSACRTGIVAGNAIMHTDGGSQYHSKVYRHCLRRLEIRQSTSRTGSCLDGAAAESFFATLKTEIGVDFWPDRASARRDIENWITAYNERRLHSSLDYRTPAEVRSAWQERMSMAL
jgi:putative transposase